MIRLVGLVLLLAGTVLAARPAAAHAVLLELAPADGAVLAAAPREILLRFDEPVTPIKVVVLNSDGRSVGTPQVPTAQDNELHLPLTGGLAEGTPAYIWDRLDEKNVDYRIYGENYFLFTRAYKIFTELYGVEDELAKKFYAKVIDTAAGGEDRGTEFNELAEPYTGRADTREHAYELLGDTVFAGKLSQFLTGDDSFALTIKRDDRLRRQFADYLYHYPFSFRSWDLKTSDLDRVREWKKDFETQMQLGHFAQFNYIWLPNDHTDGANKKTHDAFQFVAQNDVALGRVIETVARSPIWKQSLFLVVEDDAQNGPDHVDATRTIAFAAGPYVKRNALVSDRYDQLSMLRTIELLFGLRPLNLTDSMAAPMFGVFTNQPNLKPFVAVAPSNRLADADRERDRALSAR